MNREINYISIFLLYIIMKILSIITPIITLLFSLHVAPKNTLICKLGLVYSSAVKRLIASKIKVCLHNICVYLLCIYKYTHMHVYILKIFTCIYVFSYNL